MAAQDLLSDVLVIALRAVMCGAEGWQAVAAQAKRQWFKGFLSLPHGIPSRQTFERIFAALRPEALERCLENGLKRRAVSKSIGWPSKSLGGSFDRARHQAAIHMVSAGASANELVLGQVATRGNEITAIPQLLAWLDLASATVTLEAMGCHKDISGQIVEQDGDSVLAVKNHQPTLLMDDTIAAPRGDVPLSSHEEVEGDHGRIKTRRAWVAPAVDWFQDRQRWRGLRSFAAGEGEKTTSERCSFISSLDGTDAAAIAKLVRNPWHIENKLHWLLDMGFREEACRIRKGHGAENFSRPRRMALILLQREKREKLGIAHKRLLAG